MACQHCNKYYPAASLYIHIARECVNAITLSSSSTPTGYELGLMLCNPRIQILEARDGYRVESSRVRTRNNRTRTEQRTSRTRLDRTRTEQRASGTRLDSNSSRVESNSSQTR